MSDYQTWPLEWYPRVFNSSRCYLSSGSQTSQSPWTGRLSVYGPHRQFWRFELQLNPFDDGSWKAVAAFFSEAGGQAGIIRICDPARRWTQYDDEALFSEQPWSDGTFFSDGSGFLEGGLPTSIYADETQERGQTTLKVTGLPANSTRVIRRGDTFEIRRGGLIEPLVPSFHEAIRDASTDANGDTRLYFRPVLRKGVAPGDQIVLDHPMCNMRALDDMQGLVDVVGKSRGATGFTLVEAIF